MKILYICTHNRCRSILSEAITNADGDGLLVARSAGSQPVGEVHPKSIQYLEQAGYSTTGLQSQSWDEFEDFQPDIVITVCDSAAKESCPVYFGRTNTLHWGLSDPSKVSGDESQVAAAFEACVAQIQQRVTTLKAIAMQHPSAEQLTAMLANIGE